MTKIDFYVGVEFDQDFKKISQEEKRRALRFTHHELETSFGGYTAVEGLGVWNGGGPEKTAIFTIILNDGDTRGRLAAPTAKVLADLWHQESVLWTTTRVNGGYSS